MRLVLRLTELRSLLQETQFLLRRAQQVIERTRPNRGNRSSEGSAPDGR